MDCRSNNKKHKREKLEKMFIDVLIGEVLRLSFCYGAKSSHRYVYTLNQINKETKVQGTPVRIIAACAFKGMENRWENSWIKNIIRF